MDFLPFLLQGLVLGFSAAMIPGPMLAFAITTTIQKGWRKALPLALAPLISDTPIIILVMAILTQLPAILLTGMQLAGGFLLLYLAWGAWKAFVNYKPLGLDADTRTVDSTSVLKAAFINLLNPNPYIWWSTIGGVVLINAWQTSQASAVAFMLAMYVSLCGGFAFFILLFGFLGGVDKSGRVGRLLALISAIGLFGFALFQIISAIRTLVWNS